MSDDASLGQDDIEALLAGNAGGGAAKSADEKPAEQAAAGAGDAAIGQDEIEALMAGKAPPAATAAPPAPAEAAASTATAAPPTGGKNDVELLLDKAEAAIASIDDADEPLPEGVAPFRLESFGGTPANSDAATIELVRDVQLDLKIELGRTRMPLEDVLRLRRDAVVTLDKLAGDPVDVYVNGRLIARGEVLVLNDNFCVRVTELIVGDSAVA
ncbi:MAG: flagellar motor switch protein FliN [Planctomycetota bacterium]